MKTPRGVEGNDRNDRLSGMSAREAHEKNRRLKRQLIEQERRANELITERDRLVTKKAELLARPIGDADCVPKGPGGDFGWVIIVPILDEMRRKYEAAIERLSQDANRRLTSKWGASGKPPGHFNPDGFFEPRAS
jgi:hypothetical protein